MSILFRAGKILRAELGARLSDLGARLQNGTPGARVEDSQNNQNSQSTSGSGSTGSGPGRRGPSGSHDQNSRRASELEGYYANLEVPFGADLKTVEAAWKSLQRRYHPDLHGQDPQRQKTATEIVKGLNRAYEAIKKHHGR